MKMATLEEWARNALHEAEEYWFGDRSQTQTKQTVTPISPDAVLSQPHVIPEAVIKAFNEAILAKWNGQEAEVREDEVAIHVGLKDKEQVFRLFTSDWKVVEVLYSGEGWYVEYHAPCFRSATFTFYKK